jgi:hypothetical protein
VSTPAEALAALRAPDQRNQGRAHTPETGEITAEALAAIEAHAVTVRAWNPQIIPGLLQTTRYAVGAIASARPAFPAHDVQRYAHQRAARVDGFLARWQGSATVGEAVFVIAEQALRLPLVHPHAHRAQLRQLLNLTAHPRISLLVIPAGRAVPGRHGQMSLYALAPTEPHHGHGVRVGYLETPVGGWYTTRPRDVARLHHSFDDLTAAALSRGGTRDLIEEALAA